MAFLFLGFPTSRAMRNIFFSTKQHTIPGVLLQQQKTDEDKIPPIGGGIKSIGGEKNETMESKIILLGSFLLHVNFTWDLINWIVKDFPGRNT